MKKILLPLVFVLAIGCFNPSSAQCSGANAVITNFTVLPTQTSVNFGFDWTYVLGNASISVAFLCNGVELGSLDCIPRLKDSAAGPHHVQGTYPITCNGVITVAVRVWASPACGGTNCAVTRDVSQIILPVSFKSVSATRNHTTVVVKWTTATEQDNNGFAIERNTNGNWEQVGFISTQASSGTSAAPLSYQFIDNNNVRGMSQYRIKQIDINAKARYSEVVAVRGDGQSGKTVIYPNPSADGKVNIVFEDAMVSRDITVSDMSGKTIRQLRNITNNSVVLENLTPGMYSIRIVVPATGDQSVEKIVVNKR